MANLNIPEGMTFQEDTQLSSNNSLIIPQGMTFTEETKPQGSRLSALWEGAKLGADTLATYGDKFVSHFIQPLMGGPKPEEFQLLHEKTQKDFEENKDVKAHPYYGMAGNVGAQLALTAPTMVYNPASLIGKIGFNAATGAALNNAAASVEPGAGSSIFEPTAIKQGALFGAALTAPQAVIGAWTKGASNLQKVSDSLEAIGAKTKPIAADFENGIWNQITNKALGLLPSKFGMVPYRQNQQYQQFVPDITNYLKQIGAASPSTSTVKLQNILAKEAGRMEGLESTAWDTFKNAANNAGIKNIPLNNVDDLKKTILNSPASSKSLKDIINKLPSNPSIDDTLTFKRGLWSEYLPLAKKSSKSLASTDELNLANTLKQGYFDSTDSIKNAILGTPAESAFNKANAMTIGNKSLFDPKTNKALVNAIDSTKGYNDDIREFTASMLNGKSRERMATNLGLIGEEGRNLLAGQGINEILTKNLDMTNAQFDTAGRLISSSAPLNVAGFLKGMNQAMNSGARDIYKPNYEALQGLMTVMQQYNNSNVKGLAKQVGGLVASAGLLGGAGYAINPENPAGTAAILAAPIALSAFARYAPLKSTLIGLNRIANPSDNPELYTYLINKASTQLPKIGLTIYNHPSTGSIMLDSVRNISPQNQQNSFQTNTPSSVIGVRN